MCKITHVSTALEMESFPVTHEKLLATIFQSYTPELVPGFPVVLQPRVTLRPKYGMRMRLESTRVGVPVR
jgi:hypothetical protein